MGVKTMAKNTKTPKGEGSDLLASLGKLISTKGARIGVVEWASTCMENAETYYGIEGNVLLDRTLEISEAAKTGRVVKHKKHLTTYLNQVRDDLIASGKVQRRYIPVIVNTTKMAASFLTKEPITMDMVLGFVDPMLQNMITTAQNTIESYLARIVPIQETRVVLTEKDFYSYMEEPIRKRYRDFIEENWNLLNPVRE
jgi:hypothetical protein